MRQIQASWVAKPDAVTAQNNCRKVLLLKPRLSIRRRASRKVGPLADVLTDAIRSISWQRQTTPKRRPCASVTW